MVPLAGIEPALLAESDFESDASTSSAIGARDRAAGYRTRALAGSMRALSREHHGGGAASGAHGRRDRARL